MKGTDVIFTVTMKTGPSTWSTVTLPAATHEDAITQARRLVGGAFVSVV
jgi:hypothetical protein